MRGRGRARRGPAVVLGAVAAVAALAAGTARAAHAQADSSSERANLWLVSNGEHAWSSRWALLAAAQLRRTAVAREPKQLLLRSGLQYTWTKHVNFAADYTYFRTSPTSPLAASIPVDEHRAAEQLPMALDAGRLGLDQRVRLEQRWMQTVTGDGGPPRVTGRAYGNRGRYQLRVTHPLHAGPPKGPGWYALAADELFLRWGPDAGRTFDQNRPSVGLGFTRSEAPRAEGSYLNQYRRAARGRARENSRVLQLSLLVSAPLHSPPGSGR